MVSLLEGPTKASPKESGLMLRGMFLMGPACAPELHPNHPDWQGKLVKDQPRLSGQPHLSGQLHEPTGVTGDLFHCQIALSFEKLPFHAAKIFLESPSSSVFSILENHGFMEPICKLNV